ncbi:siderophore-interacting protein [Brucellaceae bacterium C25G]
MTILQANLEASVQDPSILIDQISKVFEEHAQITKDKTVTKITLPYGSAELFEKTEFFCANVTSHDDAGLAYMKYAIAHQLTEMLKQQNSEAKFIWHGDGAAGTVLAFLREMTVVSNTQVTPLMRRVRLRGDNLERFTRDGLHVRLLFPKHKDVPPKWPVMGETGIPVWPEGEQELVGRAYTIRHIDADAGTVDIDLVLHAHDDEDDQHHDGGFGARWALEAVPGDIVGMTGPGGGTAPFNADWYLLAGDETALPAISRILENLPAGSKATVRIEIADKDEEQVLNTKAELDLRWLHRNGTKDDRKELLCDAVQEIEYPDHEENIFVWVGCEFSAFRSIRSFIRKEKKIPREKHLVVAYWRQGTSGDDARRE